MTLKDILEMLSYVATIFGIPFALFLYWDEKRKERRDREYGTYDALDNKYIEFLQLLLEYPHLDVYYHDGEKEKELNEEQYVQQMILFEILISLLERAYLMYRDQSNEIKRKQFVGWAEYMRDWARKPSFLEAWKKLSSQYDEDFVEYMNKEVISKNNS